MLFIHIRHYFGKGLVPVLSRRMIGMTGSRVDRCEIHKAVGLPYQMVVLRLRRRDHAYHVRDNHISGTKKGEIAGGKPANGDIT